jgi:hypothetical protein
MSFPIEPQRETNWCWAAVSSSVDHYFNPHSTLNQCGIAGRFLKRDCCTDPDNCDTAMALQDVLGPLARLDHPIVGPVHFVDIKNEIDARRPVAVRVEWFDGNAHFVVICGYTIHQSGLRTIDVADSFYGDVFGGTYSGIWTIDFDLFPASYQQGGEWTATFLLKANPGERR